MNDFIITISNQKMWGAIIACIGIIAIGFTLTKLNILKPSAKGILNSVVLKIALPALALVGFMKSITQKQLIEQSIILGLSFAFYIVLNLVAILMIKYGKNLNFLKNKKATKLLVGEDASESKVLVTWMMLIFGSVTFFGLPIIQSVYSGGNAVLAANIWTIPYRIFLYSLAFMMMAKIKFTKDTFGKSIKTALLNPIVIATFIGLILWLTQLIPGTQVVVAQKTYGWFNLSVTAPYIHRIFDTLGKLASPLIWITIGMTLAATPIMKGIKNIKVWLFVIAKLVVIPSLVLLMMLPFVLMGQITKDVASAMVIFAAVPPATVVIAYAMEYKNNEEYAAQCSAISTLVAVFTMPIWIVILGVVF